MTNRVVGKSSVEISDDSRFTGDAVLSQQGKAKANHSKTRFFNLTSIWIAGFDLLLVAAFGIANRAFVSRANLESVALDASEIVLLAVAEGLLLAAREFDISLGANLVLASVVGGTAMVALSGSTEQVQSGVFPHLAVGLAVGIALTVIVGSIVGLLNGIVVAYLKINSLICTLATYGIASGVAYIITDGGNVAFIPAPIQRDFGLANVFSVIPLPACVAIGLIVIVSIPFYRGRFGIQVKALGSSREAAWRAGVRIERRLVGLFVFAGFVAGVGGLFDIARFATTDVGGHANDALSAIAGAVIGGASLQGGRASIGGAIAGAFISVLLASGLVILGLSSFYQLIAVGLILLVAVWVDQRRRNVRAATSSS